MNGLIRFGVPGLVAMWVLAGCGTTTAVNNAPVEDRSTTRSATAAVKPLPGIENAGKPGYYTVKPNDTLSRIAQETGQSTRDLTRWNALENPNKIEVGQVLRVIPPVAGETAAATNPKPAPGGGATSTPVPAPGSATAAAAAATSPAPAKPASTPASPAANPDDDVNWLWPAKGPVLTGFDEAKNKGLDIGGTAGDPVLASADGKVMYAGDVRGYGKLIIVKHNSVYLTAYAHNQTLLVKEDQTVKRGQKIAEMGSTDADRVKLHFELRRLGKAVDPIKYLPDR